MFSIFKKKPKYPSYQEDPVGFLLFDADTNINITREALPNNYNNQDYEYVAWNSDGAIRELLTKHAIEYRVLDNLEQALETLKAANEFLDHIELAVEKADAMGAVLESNEPGKTNFIYASNFTYAFIAVCLLQDWGRAQRLANAMMLPVVYGDVAHTSSGSAHAIPEMFAALILDDKTLFKKYQKKFQDGKSYYYYWDKHFYYDQLMVSVLERDEERVNQFLTEQETRYLQRKTDKKLDGSTVEGDHENNDRVYDVIASALCNVARYYGINVTHQSEVIPSINGGRLD